MPVTPVSFRCKTCGRLHTSGDAAESEHPHACRVCGGGVSFDPKTGKKSLDPGNWERLQDAAPARLAELGLDPAHVEKHTPWPKGHAPHAQRHVEVSARDAAAAADAA